MWLKAVPDPHWPVLGEVRRPEGVVTLFNIERVVNATESVRAHSVQSAGWVLWPTLWISVAEPRQISAEPRPLENTYTHSYFVGSARSERAHTHTPLGPADLELRPTNSLTLQEPQTDTTERPRGHRLANGSSFFKRRYCSSNEDYRRPRGHRPRWSPRRARPASVRPPAVDAAPCSTGRRNSGGGRPCGAQQQLRLFVMDLMGVERHPCAGKRVQIVRIAHREQG